MYIIDSKTLILDNNIYAKIDKINEKRNIQVIDQKQNADGRTDVRTKGQTPKGIS